MKAKKLLSLFLALTMVLLLAACGGNGSSGGSSSSGNAGNTSGAQADAGADAPAFDKMTWSAATSGADGSNFAAGLEKFRELMAEKTGGAVTVEIYTSDQLTNGNQADSLQGVMDGTIDMAFQDMGLWGNFDPSFNVIFLPFLFSSLDDLDAKLFNGEGGDYLRSIAETKFGVKALGIGESGFRYITNNKHPIEKPEDLKGLKLRVAGSPLLTKTYELWGADYTVAPFAEVYTGLQTGLYDGQENPVAVADASSIQEVTKYVTTWTAQYSGMLMFMNGDLYNGLSDELKAIVDECGEEACAYQVELTRQQNEDLLKNWQEEYGIEVTEVTPENAARFKEMALAVYDEYADNQELLSLFQ